MSVAGQSLPSFTSRKVITTMRLRDGESNMIAGLLREDERRSLRGFPGLLRVPVLRDLFTSNDHRIETSDIVMLLTPRIVRTQEITADDLRPISIGTGSNVAIGGSQGPVFGGMSVTGQSVAQPQATIPGAPAGGVPTQPAAAAPGVPSGAPIPPAGTVQRPVPDLTTPPQPPAGGQPVAPVPNEPTPSAAQIQIIAPAMSVGQPTSVPVSIANASRVTQAMISVAYDPKLLRPRNISQGNFMAQGSVPVTFLPRIDEAAGRIDIVVSRPGDTTGASGAGLLASIQFDALAAGDGTFAVSGTATSPEGQAVPLQFFPAQFRIR